MPSLINLKKIFPTTVGQGVIVVVGTASLTTLALGVIALLALHHMLPGALSGLNALAALHLPGSYSFIAGGFIAFLMSAVAYYACKKRASEALSPPSPPSSPSYLSPRCKQAFMFQTNKTPEENSHAVRVISIPPRGCAALVNGPALEMSIDEKDINPDTWKTQVTEKIKNIGQAKRGAKVLSALLLVQIVDSQSASGKQLLSYSAGEITLIIKKGDTLHSYPSSSLVFEKDTVENLDQEIGYGFDTNDVNSGDQIIGLAGPLRGLSEEEMKTLFSDISSQQALDKKIEDLVKEKKWRGEVGCFILKVT